MKKNSVANFVAKCVCVCNELIVGFVLCAQTISELLHYMYVWQQRQVRSQHAVVQDNMSVQMAGVYQFLLHALCLGVSHGTSVVMVSGTVLTTATRLDAPVSAQFRSAWFQLQYYVIWSLIILCCMVTLVTGTFLITVMNWKYILLTSVRRGQKVDNFHNADSIV